MQRLKWPVVDKIHPKRLQWVWRIRLQMTQNLTTAVVVTVKWGNSCITQFLNYHHTQFSHIFGTNDNTLKQILSNIQHCFFYHDQMTSYKFASPMISSSSDKVITSTKMKMLIYYLWSRWYVYQKHGIMFWSYSSCFFCLEYCDLKSTVTLLWTEWWATVGYCMYRYSVYLFRSKFFKSC